MKYSEKRKILFVFVVITAATIMYMIYMLNSLSNHDESMLKSKIIEENLNYKIKALEKKATENEMLLKRLEKFYQDLIEQEQKRRGASHKPAAVDWKDETTGRRPFFPPKKEQSELIRFKNQCEWFEEQSKSTSDVQTTNLLEMLTFEDVDGGVWKQGFDITYEERQWTKDNKLNVFIVPHSHNDPGWLLTFEEYFEQRTKNILDTVVNSLSEKSSRRFIWAETSYLSLWWKQASDEMKAKMKRLILETKQLEIVTGGWVMTDEANSHYYAMIEQMIEGHEWLRANIGKSVEPRYGWSIDPFGYTPTMAYLLKQMGFEGMLIQRVHYHLKKYMALNKRLEFMWKQSWSTPNSKDTSIFCHVMPFYAYDIPHTCGPDPKVCCQFDFAELRGSCPWGKLPQEITEKNIQERASLLLDQYRKKAQLYGDKNNHKFVLIPLGGDFRYQTMSQANDQFLNYERLIEYMNSRSDWNVNARFGTLGEYFQALHEHNRNNNKQVETFSGDFFTYADRNDHYWSGYFTSRIFTKRLDRIVEYYLRTAEILFSISNLIQEKFENKFTKANELFKHLLTARRNLGLFQHHDGITGTAKTHVVRDYVRRLYGSLEGSRNIIEQSLTYLLTKQRINSENVFELDDVRLYRNDLEEANNPNVTTRTQDFKEKVIELTNDQSEKKVVLFNGNLNKREELVSFRINVPNVEVIEESTGSFVKNVQVSLVWPNTDGGRLTDFNQVYFSNTNKLDYAQDFSDNVFELMFEVNLSGLSTKTYIIRKANDKKGHLSGKVIFYHLKNITAELISENQISVNKRLESIGFDSSIELQTSAKSNDEELFQVEASDEYKALFSSKSGLLQKFVSNSHGREMKSKIQLIKYGTTLKAEKSGAYLFLPDGPAKALDPSTFRWIRVESGNLLRNRVCVQTSVVLHCVEFYPTVSRTKQLKLPYLSVWNVIDLRKEFNYELAMHIETDVNNEDTIHTDLNGFQYVKRKRYEKLTLQGNVFPMPTGAFIQDSRMRFNILGGQPMGVASLENSCMQVFLDRRLDQDDELGLGQAINDNIISSNRLLLFYERVYSPKELNTARSSFPSLLSQILSNDLLNPILKLVLSESIIALKSDVSFLNRKVPCDLRLVNMRSLQNDHEEARTNEVALIIHRLPLDYCENKANFWDFLSAGNFIELTDNIRDYCQAENMISFNFADLFDFLNESQIKRMRVHKSYLSLSFDENQIEKYDMLTAHVQPMGIEAFKVFFKYS